MSTLQDLQAFIQRVTNIFTRAQNQTITSVEVVPSVQYGSIPLSLQAMTHDVTYSVSKHKHRSKRGALVDRGANGGIIGNDAKVIYTHQRVVDVTGIDNHELPSLKIVDASSKILTQKGPAIAIMRQYAYHGVGRTIHSCGQIEIYKNQIDDRSMKVGGRQCIKTIDGFIIPIDIINGLPYIKMDPHTDDEYATLPHVILTSGNDWDPRRLDFTLSDREDWFDLMKEKDPGLYKSPFDINGEFIDRKRPPALTPVVPDPDEEIAALDDKVEDDCIDVNLHDIELEDVYFRACFHEASNLNLIYISYSTEVEEDIAEEGIESLPPIEVKKKPFDYLKYRPYFLHVPIEKIRKTFQVTTQFATNVTSGPHIQQTIKSPYPANNVLRRNEPVAADTIYAEVAAVDTNGQDKAELYVGRRSLVIGWHGMKSDNEFVDTLLDEIRFRGAMDVLITDSARVETSARVKDVLRSLVIQDWQSEPHYQHQNFAEHRWKHFKRNLQWYMNFRNVDPDAWLLCGQWIADVMNHTAEKSLGWRTPLQVLTGRTTDISILLCFLFWDIVYVNRYKDQDYSNQPGSKKSNEIRGRFVGFAWNVGHALTFRILTDDTRRVINRSVVRLAKVGENNLKLDHEAGAVPERIYIHSKREDDETLPTIDASLCPFTGYDENHTSGNKIAEVPDDSATPAVNATTPAHKDQAFPIGTAIRKRFSDGWYNGKVTTYYPEDKLYHILYGDGDSEDLSEAEVRKFQRSSKSASSNKTTKGIAKRTATQEKATPAHKVPQHRYPLRAHTLDQTASPTLPPEVTFHSSKQGERNGNYFSTMEDPPLRDTPMVETVDNESDFPYHLLDSTYAQDPPH